MRLLHKYFFAANGDVIGYHAWDADRKPPPDDSYVEQMPPVGILTDDNGKEKYKKKEANPKSGTTGNQNLL
jgi:hypothetical protein